jgi:hypothetical protein
VLTKVRAERHAEQVKAFWDKRGVAIDVRVEPIYDGNMGAEFEVRSDLLLSATPRQRRP